MFGLLCDRNNTMPAHAQNALHSFTMATFRETTICDVCRKLLRYLWLLLHYNRSSATAVYNCLTTISFHFIYNGITNTCTDGNLCVFFLTMVNIQVFSSTILKLKLIFTDVTEMKIEIKNWHWLDYNKNVTNLTNKNTVYWSNWFAQFTLHVMNWRAYK